MAEKRKLPSTAYEIKEGETYVPYTAGQDLSEFTFKAAISGILLGMVFGAANTYLGPEGRPDDQYVDSGGGAHRRRVQAAVRVRLEALDSRGEPVADDRLGQLVRRLRRTLHDPGALPVGHGTRRWAQLSLLAMSGGLIGVLAMVPLRRYLIKREHGKLPYPEGMACAEVLVASEGGGQAGGERVLGPRCRDGCSS